LVGWVVDAATHRYLRYKVRHSRNRGSTTDCYMAEYVGLDRSFISDLGNGKKEICMRNLEVLATAFGLSMSQLLSRL
jgi:hypothetical protein